MEDLSLHILDIVENSVTAGARLVSIAICEEKTNDLLSIEITDDGEGMSEELLRRATDPFFTRKKTRRVGLGLSLLKQAAEMANGSFTIESGGERGTRVKANFQYSHIDRQPLGNICETLETLVIGNPAVDFYYQHKRGGVFVDFDTRKIREELSKIGISSAQGIKAVREQLSTVKRIISKADEG